MNLHELRPPGVWFWIRARNGRGVSMGQHIYQGVYVPRPPINPTPPPRNQNRYYTDPHFSWRPYGETLPRLFVSGGWAIPICGKRSRASFIRADFGIRVTWDQCADCARIANERDTIPMYYQEFTRTDPESVLAGVEHNEWYEARQR